eukprot:scaffold59223_cov48-Phaeocystis_antarctica.AAC.3
MDKKGDKKLDADELLLMMKALGWVLPAQVQQGRRGGHDLGGGRGLRSVRRLRPAALPHGLEPSAPHLLPPSATAERRAMTVQVRGLGGVQGDVLPREKGQVGLGAPPTIRRGRVHDARQHGRSDALAVPQLGSCASSRRAWRLQAAWHS